MQRRKQRLDGVRAAPVRKRVSGSPALGHGLTALWHGLLPGREAAETRRPQGSAAQKELCDDLACV